MPEIPREESARDKLARTSCGAAFLPFLGLAATRIWFQTCLYGGYIQSDNGLITLLCDLPYGIMLLVVAALSYAHRPSKKVEMLANIHGSVGMCIAAILLAFGLGFGGTYSTAVLIFTGIVAVMAWLVWAPVYAQLPFKTAVLYIFGSMALGSLGGLAISPLPPEARMGIAAAMPLLALICQRKAEKAVEEQQEAGHISRPDAVYDNEPLSTVLIIAAGIAVFGFALGITRGYPLGEPHPFTFGERAIHQLGVVVLCIGMIWWVVIAERNLSFSALWRAMVFIMGFCVLLLTTLPSEYYGIAISLSNISDTLMIGILWITLQDVTRHSTRHPYAIFGFTWAMRIITRDAGRLLIFVMGPAMQSYSVFIGLVMFSICVSVVFIFSDKIPRERPLFRDDLALPQNGTAANSASNSGEAMDQAEQAAVATQQRFDLTDRELEVAALIAQGRSKRDIGEKLFISENTVRAHVKRIYTKMDVHNKREFLDAYYGDK